MRGCMKDESQLKLQAYLDGELPSAERNEVEALLAQDADAKALFAELGNTTKALAGFEAGIKLPESREFYWSKIQREIGRQPAQTQRPAPSFAERLRRLLVPASVCAAAVIAVAIVLPQLRHQGVTLTDSDDAGVFTYHNYEAGATLVWLDYPAENNFADIEVDDIFDL